MRTCYLVEASEPLLRASASRRVVLEARSLSKVYAMGDVDVVALREIDIDLYEGEIVVILGASGSGKSTLLHLLGGLDTPTSGEIHWGDHDLAHADDAELTAYRREHVGFVFQFYNLIPSLTARENVALVTEIAERPMSPDEALELVGLGERRDHFPSQLSGGEQQRVAIARAVAKRPEFLLCDEPTGALDCETGRIVLEVLASIHGEVGTTTAVITHNAPIASMADRIVRLSAGRIADVRSNDVKALPRDISW